MMTKPQSATQITPIMNISAMKYLNIFSIRSFNLSISLTLHLIIHNEGSGSSIQSVMSALIYTNIYLLMIVCIFDLRMKSYST